MPNSTDSGDVKATDEPGGETAVPSVPMQPAPAPPTARAGAAPPASADDILAIGGGFRKRKLIGHGGFGEVWSAETQGGGFPVAIKIILKSLEHAEAQRELKALELIKNLSHPFLLQTREYWSHEGRLYIVMELADCSLRERFRACRREGHNGIPLAELLPYLRESAEALDYLHSEHVHHRDIKPENILLLKGHVKVADFGLASELEKRRLATISGSNTPLYAAPEIDRRKVSPHSDQYSLAMTYAELRLGRAPFEAQSLYELVILKNTEMPDLVGLEDNEKEILFKALAKDPDQRYPTCREFFHALEQTLTSALAVPAVPVKSSDSSKGSTLPDSVAGDLQRTLMPSAPTSRMPLSAGPDAGTTDPNMPAANWRLTERRRRSWSGPVVALAFFALIAGGVYYVATRPGTTDPSTRADLTEPSTKSQADKPFPTLPANCEKLPNNRGPDVFVHSRSQIRYYHTIAYVLQGGERVVFRLIPPTDEGPQTAFYMMRDQVTNGLFARFAMARPDAVKNSHWTQGAQKGDQDLGNQDPLLPVMRITAEEAHGCARWLGGYLPSTAQYDRAAGHNVELAEPNPLNKAAWDKLSKDEKLKLGVNLSRDGFLQWNNLSKGDQLLFGVNRAERGPMRIDEPTLDVGPHGCRHLAGNGREYTNNLWKPNKLLSSVFDKENLNDAEVELRGKSYRSHVPSLWRFGDGGTADLDRAKCRDNSQELSDIGFRVVIYPGNR
jgi:serine/threonine protein kinase/formylglycine-generating enzyme required for sulfatase activity